MTARAPRRAGSACTPARSRAAAARHIAETLPDGRHAELAGQSHEVAPEAITPAIVEFVTS
ncbi:hypothetical protein C1I98_14375 [Spongiactinospora gelatinilytica]|uniref:Alpha/beta hydrolase n=1 Tax=Spongiactinospora gelatinilytica TaxID=2666298 RepID=A0A2W2HAM1_9ACTN|nr:hypothetical protein [Spongiactinospora gelatinilytica]PZG46558.1 hypothetical protein C1I98_14375 [Spongiactinospora gelatinilytica]